MPVKKITEQELTTILSQLSSVDARDTFILALLSKETELPKAVIKETAYHFVQKDPQEAARLYLMADEKREAFQIYNKLGYIVKALPIIEHEENLFSTEERYHFFESNQLYQKGLKLAREKGNKSKAELFKILLDYTK